MGIGLAFRVQGSEFRFRASRVQELRLQDFGKLPCRFLNDVVPNGRVGICPLFDNAA